MKIDRKSHRNAEARAGLVLAELRGDLARGGGPLSDDASTILCEGLQVYAGLRVDPVAGSSYLVASWGQTAARQSMTEPRTGFDTGDLASRIWVWAREQLPRNNEETKANREAVVLNAIFNTDEFKGAYVEAVRTGGLRLRVAKALTEEQARRFLMLALELGIIGK